MIYRAPPADALLIEPLDAFTAVYHRPSGQTHLLVEPAPEILDVLGPQGMTPDALREALAERYDLSGAEDLIARLDELVAAGLVSAA